jgi:hypothetical protein
MTNILHYFEDGASAQSQAVLCALKYRIGDGLNVPIKVSTWFNGRERGYIAVVYNYANGRQFNIAWFEHRNSDTITAQYWLSNITINPPTIFNEEVLAAYEWGITLNVSVYHYDLMARYIYDTIVNFIHEEGL